MIYNDLTFLYLLLGVLATESTVEVLLKGKIFDGIRNWVYSKVSDTSFVGKLIRCPYCLSFWVSAFFTALFIFYRPLYLVLAIWLTIQRLSNYFNDLSDKIYYSQWGDISSKDSSEDIDNTEE